MTGKEKFYNPKYLYRLVSLNIKRFSSLIVRDALRFFLLFFFNYFLFFLGVYIGVWSSLKDGENFSFGQWLLCLIAPLVLVFVTYFRDLLRDAAKNRIIKHKYLSFECIGGAIDRVAEIKNDPAEERKNFIIEILVFIEKATKEVLEENGELQGNISANYMRVNEEEKNLEIIAFSSKLGSRKKKKISLDYVDPLPGAPEACKLRKVIYIDNIRSNKYKIFFSEESWYSSFISIPVIADDKVIGVVNIDSNIANQFISKKYIIDHICPVIEVIIRVYLLERFLLFGNEYSNYN